LINYDAIRDYRGYPFRFNFDKLDKYPLSDEILRMKNVSILFQHQNLPIHKLVYPDLRFVEEDRNLIENHFSYLGSSVEGNIEEWECFQMDCEGHLVSMIPKSNFHLSNESIEHLSNFPCLRSLSIYKYSENNQYMTNLSLLSNLKKLSMSFGKGIHDPEFFKDLGLFSNLISLKLINAKRGF